MKTGETLHGFKVESFEAIPEAEGVLWLLKHEKLDTPLAFLERADSNKSFYIAFRTPPKDDTGVFHIIEHSVLCGSKKFPVKEPFVELLKSSLKTFLNAMTYPDRTVYPVSSRSDKDFLNLIDVYMDAVFHPLMLENESIFMQEGHRYELDGPDSPLTLNGVVYNEMKGAMSSADEISSEKLLEMLYPNSPFGKNSGGDPEAICDLTYEGFRAAHKEHYHPSNAYIFLDGEVDLDAVLPLLDSYLSEYERRDDCPSVGEDTAPENVTKTLEYEIGAEENEDSRTRAYIGVRTFDFDDVDSGLALSVLSDAIAGNNEAPLTKAFLDAGLCEDVSVFSLGDGIKYGSYAVELKNLFCSSDEAFEFLSKTLAKIAENGIGKERLEASLNAKEFKLREKDFGSMPKGLIFGLAMLDTWLYGNDPSLGLKYEDALRSVRAMLQTDASFERMLKDVFIDNERKVRLILKPSKTLGKQKEKDEQEKLATIKSEMTEEALALLCEKNERLKLWQASEDTEEDLKTLPTLEVCDIPKEGSWTPTQAKEIAEVPVLVHEIPTGGISYAELLFDVSDLDGEELSLIAFLSSLLGRCATSSHSADELAQIKKLKLGSFAASAAVIARDNVPKPYFYVTASALDSERQSLADIVGEILNETVFTDKKAVKNLLTQKLISAKEAFVTSGHAAAVRRARAYVSSLGVLAEHIFGFEMYKRLKSAVEDFDKTGDALAERLASLLKKIVTKKRLTVALTGTPCDAFIENLTDIPREVGTAPTAKSFAPFGYLNEGIVIPSRVSYISKSATLTGTGESFTGSMHVLSNILSYTHLWNSIRVKGGAYGAGFTMRQSGDASTYSYRDPNPRASIEACDESASFLRALAEEEDSFDNYIIGTFGDYDSLNSARSAGAEATTIYLMGKTKSDEQLIRKSMLEFDKSELLRLADIVEGLMKNGGICVVGPTEQIDACMDVLKSKVEI
ncbi:MAG: insulinase family protein [Clostridia bacterium]|nr:insulinase family protein [Clostridia bacterium]